MGEFEPRRAFEHLDKLAYEIGPRLSGTRGERLAAEYIKEQFKSYGLKVEEEKFAFASSTLCSKVGSILLLSVFISSLFLEPAIAFICSLATLAVVRVLPRLLSFKRSKNVVGTLKKENSKVRVIISAHYDSAPCSISRRVGLTLRAIMQPLVIFFEIVLLARVLGIISSWSILWGALAVVYIPVFCLRIVNISPRRVSPGANDNASGVAVMLEVARAMSDSPPDGIEVSFVAFGAEEQGLFGARAFSKRATNSLVVNLDTLGVGHLCIVEGNGIMTRRATSPRVNQAMFKAAQLVGLELKPIWAIFASHDHLPLLSSGAEATTLTADLDKKKTFEKILGIFGIKNAHLRRYRYLHDPEDLPDKVELANLERAGKLVLEFVRSVKE
ncbi:MAG: hypothetical protein APU95_02565 [Hadesarchaea archaeon YNP_N21]|jgi:hypothetical protein|nr:MAG: hypothetical protein APU95_02565 [Hadesarchaea archaeon YNP_N21]